jgi:hypothetical protein
MIIGILKESSFETRTSLLPEHAAVLKKMNLEKLAKIRGEKKKKE